MSGAWIALFFFSSSWLFTVPEFAFYHWVGTVLVACGVAFGILAARGTRSDKIDPRYAVFLVPLVVSSILIPFPYSLGPALLALGLAAACLHHRLSPAGMGISFSGVMLTVQGALLPLYFTLAARYHQTNVMAYLIGALLKLMGVNASIDDGIVSVQGVRQTYPFSITWEMLASFLVLEILVGGILIILLGSKRKRMILSFVLVTLAYMLLRSVFMIFVFIDYDSMSLFWKPAVTALSFLPLCLLLVKLYPLERVPSLPPLRLDKKLWSLAGAAFLGVSLFLGVWGFHDPGTRKEGRVLIDEKHSNWEWTTEEYDTAWYGEKSGYNYYSFYTYLNSFYQVERNFETLSSELLSDYDVLILKTPTEPFSTEEVESIADFVAGGGGLFLIGDHTNVFGMSSFLNPVAGMFGLCFRYDSTYELNSGTLSEYRRPALLPHPAVQHMPPFLFATSCTLEAPLSAEAVIVGYGLKSLYADYSQKNFFPAEPETPEMTFGLFLQAAAVRHGKGRVLAFTDSTVFSNFWMFMPGKPELALGAVEWLNRTNTSPDPRYLFLAGGLALAAVALYLVTRMSRPIAFLLILCAGLFAAALSSHAYMALNRASYALPQPRTGFTLVCFEQEHSNFALPDLLEGFMAGSEEKYSTFYVWNQRLGYVPSVRPTLEEALAEGDIVVIINPHMDLTAREMDDITKYVENGGRILLLDGAGNGNPTSNQLLQEFGMRIDYDPLGRATMRYAGDRELTTTKRACSVEGGEAMVTTKAGQVVFAVQRRGKGMMAAFADAALFCDAQLGHVGSVPSEYQREISELEFWILRGLMEYRFENE